MRSIQHSYKQSGDTIVEVLIAVAIISSVLSGAFLVSQKSARAVRNSQEHSEMLQILQGQAEALRSLASKQPTAIGGVYSTSPAYFCIDMSDQIIGPKRVDFTGTLPVNLDSDTFGTGVYHTKCINIQDRYNVAITYSQSTKVFTLTGRWSGLSNGNNQEQLVYRIYPGGQ